MTGSEITRGPKVKCVAAAGVALLFLAGCGSTLVGHWKTDPIPQDADFYIMQAEFKDDGTYTASARKKGSDMPVALRGKYDFNGGELKLMQPGASDRVYRATYYMLTSPQTLEIRKDDQKQTLKKQ